MRINILYITSKHILSQYPASLSHGGAQKAKFPAHLSLFCLFYKDKRKLHVSTGWEFQRNLLCLIYTNCSELIGLCWKRSTLNISFYAKLTITYYCLWNTYCFQLWYMCIDGNIFMFYFSIQVSRSVLHFWMFEDLCNCQRYIT